MLPFGTYPHRFFKPTITTIQRATSSPPPASEQLLPSSTMTSSKASPSPSPGPETLASSHTPAPKALPDHEKFSTEERDFLRSQLPAYRAHCVELDRLGSGPRKLQGVKGDKKEWIYRHVYPEFSRKFSSGSNTQSLKQVRLATWVFYLKFVTLRFRNSQNGSAITRMPLRRIQVFQVQMLPSHHGLLTPYLFFVAMPQRKLRTSWP